MFEWGRRQQAIWAVMATSLSLIYFGEVVFGGPRKDVTDNRSWWCPQYKGKKSIREGSFFTKSRFPFKKWLLLLHFWIRQFSDTTAALDAYIHKSTAIDVYQLFREVCTTKRLNTRIMFGGNWVIVEIDESLFCHKSKL